LFLLELVQLPLCLVELLLPERCCEIGATGFLLPKLVELPLRLSEFLIAIEILQLLTLVEFVGLCLLGRSCPLLSERVGRRTAGGRSKK